ncbi:MAG: SgcJ/EcaC family oxidoreductase [Gemmatimonadota bacterium]
MIDDEELIQQIIAAQAVAWNRGDARGWVADSAPDLGFTNILGQRWETREGCEARHAAMFQGPFAQTHLAIVVERLRFTAPDSAAAELLTTLTNFAALPPGILPTRHGTLETRMVEIFTKRDGRWWITTCHNTAVLPSRR